MLVIFYTSSWNLFVFRYSHLLPKDEDAFEQYDALSAKRLDEVVDSTDLHYSSEE